MNQEQTSIPFKNWVWQDRENRFTIILTLVLSVGTFVWLKVLYPFPNFLPDSYSYLTAAYNNQSINVWPIGYSMFLRLFSSFTRSDTAFTFAQYILLQSCLLYFLFTLRYWLAPSKWVFRIILICSIANPLSPLISNFIASDALFTALSLIWLGQLHTISMQPSLNLLIRHAIVLVLAIMIRHNALYYPLISIACIAFTTMPLRSRLVGWGAILLLVGGFVTHSMYQYRQLTGHAQFSAFGGWQLASNALYSYAHVNRLDPIAETPNPFKPLQKLVNQHLDSLKTLSLRPDQELGIYYLWNDNAPLKQYLQRKWATDSTTDGFKRWASMGPLYAAYGSWLIRRHPLEYIRYFLWPNLIRYYTPDPEFLRSYNMGKDSIEEIARLWFHWKTRKISSISKTISQVWAFPIALAIINLLFVLSLIGFIWLRGLQEYNTMFSKFIPWIFAVWLGNMLFSITASPIVLRYQLFPMLFTLAFSVLLLDFIVRKNMSNKHLQLTSNQHETFHRNVAVN